MEDSAGHVTVLFTYHSPVLEEPTEEELWAKVVDEAAGVYELVSIPFYGLPLATADRFEAEMDTAQKKLVYCATVLNSGNSVVVVALLDATADLTQIQQDLVGLGCSTEQLNDNYFACAVPKDLFYGEIRSLLEDYEQQETIEFAETKLSAKHQSDLRRRK